MSGRKVEMTLGAAIRAFRDAADLSQGEVAMRAGIDRTYLSDLERDVKSPTVPVLQRVAAAMGVNASDVLLAVESGGLRRPKKA